MAGCGKGFGVGGVFFFIFLFGLTLCDIALNFLSLAVTPLRSIFIRLSFFFLFFLLSCAFCTRNESLLSLSISRDDTIGPVYSMLRTGEQGRKVKRDSRARLKRNIPRLDNTDRCTRSERRLASRLISRVKKRKRERRRYSLTRGGERKRFG